MSEDIHMTTMMIVGGIAALIIVMMIWIYNSIIANHNRCKRAWSDVITYQRQKLKVIPQVEEALANYLSHERDLQTKITALRTGIDSLSTESMDTERVMQIEQISKDVMGRLSLTMEAYPELKASELSQGLMRELSEQESDISAAISIFNQGVEAFNNGITMFPHLLVNRMFNKMAPLRPFTDSAAAEEIEFKPNLE
uniref:LemA family protein n=1 Tax=Magnetococcus massalia (strain MO-1) TaxID=451514 RepID=A0A1S7LN63_MAGMO|nr:Conserved hypothetical protein. Putative LemA family [Candidatus Magnetococcus massalia]